MSVKLKTDSIRRVKVWELDHSYNVELVLNDNSFSLNIPNKFYTSIHFDVENNEELYNLLLNLKVKSFLLIKGCYDDGCYEKTLDYLKNII